MAGGSEVRGLACEAGRALNPRPRLFPVLRVSTELKCGHGWRTGRRRVATRGVGDTHTVYNFLWVTSCRTARQIPPVTLVNGSFTSRTPTDGALGKGGLTSAMASFSWAT